MENKSCPFLANEDQVTLQTSWLLRSNVIYSTFLAIGTFLFTMICVHFMKKHPIFHNSTKFLLYFSLFFANLHDFSLMGMKWVLMYRSFYYANDPCYLFFDVNECYPYSRLLFIGITGMIYIHSALTLDGVLAYFFPQSYYKYEKVPGYVLIVILFIVSMIVMDIVLPFNFVSNEYLPSCQFFPSFAARNANIFLLSSLGLTAINLAINIAMLQMNISSEKRATFNVIDKYQRCEAMMTSKAVSLLVIAQISALVIYELGVFTLRMNKPQISEAIYSNIIYWVYSALSHATFSLPLLIIYCIKYVRRDRQRSIHNMTTHKESIENRMDELRLMWS